MAQHFLHSAAARSLSPAKVMRMSDRGAENVFLRLRWPQTDGKPVCPRCGCERPLLRLSPLGYSAALALQGLPRRFFGDIGHFVRLA
jgi:hypothetical protein